MQRNNNNMLLLRRFLCLLLPLMLCMDQSNEVESIPIGKPAVNMNDNAEADSQIADDSKLLKICQVGDALNILRLASSNTRHLFREALEDVELIRECIGEAAINGGIVGGLHNLHEMSRSLDVDARNISLNSSSSTITDKPTTVSLGLGYVDDRKDRRIERYVSLAPNIPFVGTKQNDMEIIDAASNILPWIVDRRSTSDNWYVSHQNGQNRQQQSYDYNNLYYLQQDDEQSSYPSSNKLYSAAWIGTYGEAWLYYPPSSKKYGHPFNLGDVVGPKVDTHKEEFVQPNLPQNNPTRRSHFTSPYPDTAVPGLSLITAHAPVYYTGEFNEHTYNNTYVASTGIDISIASMSSLLDELEDTLVEGSFAFIADASSSSKDSSDSSFQDDLLVVALSQSTVEKIYPTRTGMEDVRIIYDNADNPNVINDRRNQTYLVSDTIFQSLTNLTNANWTELAKKVKSLRPGERSSTVMDIALTGDVHPTSYYVVYEKWADVADWVMVVLAPRENVDNAVSLRLDKEAVDLEAYYDEFVQAKSTVYNEGTLDVTVRIHELPPWIKMVSTTLIDARSGVKPSKPQRMGGVGQQDDDVHNLGVDQRFTIPAGHKLTFTFSVGTASSDDDSATTKAAALLTSVINFHFLDDNYPDCVYEEVSSFKISLKLLLEDKLNHLNRIRIYGLVLSIIIMTSSSCFSIWVIRNKKHRVVRASQPIFLHFMCFGTLVMGASIIPMGFDDGILSERGCSIACMAVPWLLFMGFSVAFSALFSKIWRINQIVRACKNFKRVHVSVRDVMVPFVIICTINLTLLSLWTRIDPLVWVRKPLNGFNEFSSIGRCSSQGHKMPVTFTVLLLLVNFVALVLALIQLYKARELSTEYSEGKYIAVAVGSVVQAFLSGLPVLVLVTDSPQLSYFVKSSIVFIITMSLLLLTFVPKFLITGSRQCDSQASSTAGLDFVMDVQIVEPYDGPNEKLDATQKQPIGLNRTKLSHSCDKVAFEDVCTKRANAYIDVCRGYKSQSIYPISESEFSYGITGKPFIPQIQNKFDKNSNIFHSGTSNIAPVMPTRVASEVENPIPCSMKHTKMAQGGGTNVRMATRMVSIVEEDPVDEEGGILCVLSRTERGIDAELDITLVGGGGVVDALEIKEAFVDEPILLRPAARSRGRQMSVGVEEQPSSCVSELTIEDDYSETSSTVIKPQTRNTMVHSNTSEGSSIPFKSSTVESYNNAAIPEQNRSTTEP